MIEPRTIRRNTMVKILYLNEYIRVNHTTQHKNGTVSVDYANTSIGRDLKKRMREHDVDPKLIEFEYVYPHIPDPKKVDNRGNPVSYQDPKLKEAKPYFEKLTKKIIEDKPDVVVVNGKLGCKFLLGSVSITKLRGVPEEVTLEDEALGEYTFWVLPMFSMEYVNFQPNISNYLDDDLRLLHQYIQEGDTAFKPEPVTYTFLNDIDSVNEVFDYLKEHKPTTAWDLETNTLKPESKGSKALVISLSWEHGQGVTIPIEHKDFGWSEEDKKTILNHIKSFVADPTITKVGHNISYDIKFLMVTYGFTEFSNHLDTMIAYYLVVNQDNKAGRTLNKLSYELTDMGGYDKPLDGFKDKYVEDYKAEHGRSKKPINEIDGSNFNYEWIPLDILSPYASGDVDATLRIHKELYSRMQGQYGWEDLYTDFYPKLTVTLARMEANGLPLDDDYRQTLYVEYGKEYDRLVEELRNLPSVQELEEQHRAYYEAGLAEMEKPKDERDEEVAKLRNKYKKKLEFNPNSPADKGTLLFQILSLKLPVNKEYVKDSAMNKNPKTPDDLNWDDYSTSKDVLKYIQDEYESFERGKEAKEVADRLLQISKISTLQGYAKSYIPDRFNKLHGRFNIVGTASTRLSSSQPNLQNLSTPTQNVQEFTYNYPIKRLFKSEFDNGVIMQADYNGLEMRVLALRTGDEAMTQAFLEDRDFHTNTASIVYDKPEEQITKDERQSAKAVAFGIVYGESPNSLAPKLNVTQKESQEIFDKFLATKPKLNDFVKETHKSVEEIGYVQTMQGHVRYLKDVWAKDKGKQAGALRQSVNTIIQGTGAYLTNYSLITIDNYIQTKGKRSKLIATVHDSIVLDVPEEEVEEMGFVVKYIMEKLPIDFLFVEFNGETIRFPITADLEIGSSYADLVDYNPEEYKQFNTAKGYIKYHLSRKQFIDKAASNVITEKQLEESLNHLENHIHLFQEIE